MDVNLFIQTTISEIRETASRKNISIHFKGVEGKCMVNADETYLQQILENLLSNALKFSNEGKDINVELKAQGDRVRISVADEGPGIKPEEAEKLFERFSRLSTKPTGGESSTGLGLFLVRKYVERLGGEVAFVPTQAKGATFVVDLPTSA